jgi:Lrp/AsnC family transcriptional regulator, leucine-responsive regulatory protein
MIDGIDYQILTFLRDDARISNAEIARQVGMAPSAILERIRKLESKGIVVGYRAKIDPTALGLGFLCYIRIKAEEPVNSMEVGEMLAAFPEVQEVHYTAGEDGYLIKVRSANAEALGKFLRDKVGSIPHITSTQTTVVLTTVKETAELPVVDPSAENVNG